MKALVMKGILGLVITLLKGSAQSPAMALRLGRIKATLWYLQSIKTIRLLFAALIGTIISLIMFIAGMIIFHMGVFVYAPFSGQEKMWLALICAAVYFFAAFQIFSHIFDSQKWIDIFNAQHKVDNLYHMTRPPESQQATEEKQRSS